MPIKWNLLADWLIRSGSAARPDLGAWQVAAHYSHGDFSDQDIMGGVGDSFTLGMNWWWTAYSRVQFNYIYGSIAERGLLANLPGITSGDYNVVGVRWMVDF